VPDHNFRQQRLGGVKASAVSDQEAVAVSDQKPPNGYRKRFGDSPSHLKQAP
jgi:hypothetical protein